MAEHVTAPVLKGLADCRVNTYPSCTETRRKTTAKSGDLQLSLIDFTGLQGIWFCKDITAFLISQLCFFVGSSAAAQGSTAL